MKLGFLKAKESKNAIWLISGKIAQMILSLFVGVISARYLGPSNYGLISYGTAMVGFFMTFCNLGINSVIVKEFFDHPDEQGKTLGSAILMRIISSILSSVAVIAVSFFLDYGDWETIVIVALCSISLVFHAFDTLNYWFQSQYKSNVTAISIFLAYVATSVYKIVLLIFNKSVFWFAFASSVDYIVLSIILLIAYKMNNGQKMMFSFKSGKRILKKSYHYILAGMMTAIYGHTDKLMLKQMLGESEVGYYATAVAICSMWTFVLSAIIDAMYPTIIKSFKQTPELFDKKNRQLYAIVFYITVFVSVMFLIFGEFGIWLLYGEEYLPAATPLRIITWYTAFSYFGVARNAWMVCNEKQKYLKYMYVVAAVMNVVLNLIFIPLWGGAGAAFASLITQICTSIVLPYCIKDLRPNAKLMLEAIILKDVFSKKANN
ncbi:MAG: flippase [Clostridia bacterium]|nr:flippase [Clostridia bacterium]